MDCYLIKVRVYRQKRNICTALKACDWLVYESKWQYMKIFWHKKFGKINFCDRNVLDAGKFKVVSRIDHCKLREQILDKIDPKNFEQIDARSVRCVQKLGRHEFEGDFYGGHECEGDFYETKVIEKLNNVKSMYYFVRRNPRQCVFCDETSRHQKYCLKKQKNVYFDLHFHDNECDESQHRCWSARNFYRSIYSYGNNRVRYVNSAKMTKEEFLNTRKIQLFHQGGFHPKKSLKRIACVPVHVGRDVLVRQSGDSLHYIYLPQPKFVEGQWQYKSLEDDIALDFGFASFYAHQRAMDLVVAFESVFPPYVLLEICSFLPWLKHTTRHKVIRIFVAVQQFLLRKGKCRMKL